VRQPVQHSPNSEASSSFGAIPTGRSGSLGGEVPSGSRVRHHIAPEQSAGRAGHGCNCRLPSDRLLNIYY
jgi:hypothetical protein